MKNKSKERLGRYRGLCGKFTATVSAPAQVHPSLFFLQLILAGKDVILGFPTMSTIPVGPPAPVYSPRCQI